MGPLGYVTISELIGRLVVSPDITRRRFTAGIIGGATALVGLSITGDKYTAAAQAKENAIYLDSKIREIYRK